MATSMACCGSAMRSMKQSRKRRPMTLVTNRTVYVLRETLASKLQGKPLYFEKMVGSIPLCTGDMREAAKFGSEVEAIASPARRFAFATFRAERFDQKEDTK